MMGWIEVYCHEDGYNSDSILDDPVKESKDIVL